MQPMSTTTPTGHPPSGINKGYTTQRSFTTPSQVTLAASNKAALLGFNLQLANQMMLRKMSMLTPSTNRMQTGVKEQQQQEGMECLVSSSSTDAAVSCSAVHCTALPRDFHHPLQQQQRCLC